jgi:spore germination protein GerM
VCLLAAASACGSSDERSSSVADTAPVTATDADTTTSATSGTAAPDTTADTTAVTEPSVTEAPAPSATDAPAVTAAPATDPTTTEPATEPAAMVDVRLYLLREEHLAIAHRTVAGPAVLQAALTELLAVPTADTTEIGLHSEIPANTELLGVNLADGLATVDLSSEFESGGGTLSMTARVAQIVFTATQFDNVDSVLFHLDGEPVEFLGGEGLVVSDPLTRSSTDRAFTGGVIIDSPTPGTEVNSPFVVTGEGDVFEAEFPIEIWRDGEQIGRVGPVRAGAWGNWADFEATVTLDVSNGPIELIAYDAGGCGDDPDCPPIIRTVVPLTYTGAA